MYVTGEHDTVRPMMDVASLESLRDWCVFDTASRITYGAAHEIVSPAALSWAFAALAEHARTDPAKLGMLDQHRGMAAQKATGSRRLMAQVEANERALRERREELESHLIAAPAANWAEAAEKARYVIGLYAASLGAGDTQRHTLVAAVLADFERLAAEEVRAPISP